MALFAPVAWAALVASGPETWSSPECMGLQAASRLPALSRMVGPSMSCGMEGCLGGSGVLLARLAGIAPSTWFRESGWSVGQSNGQAGNHVSSAGTRCVWRFRSRTPAPPEPGWCPSNEPDSPLLDTMRLMRSHHGRCSGRMMSRSPESSRSLGRFCRTGRHSRRVVRRNPCRRHQPRKKLTGR